MTGFILTAALGTTLWALLCVRAWRGGGSAASQRQAINAADYAAGLDRIKAAQDNGELDAQQAQQETLRLKQQLLLATEAEAEQSGVSWSHKLRGPAKMALFVLPLSLASIVFLLTQGQAHWPQAQAAPSAADVEGMVAQLASRLEQNPEDTQGWLMLGRSYMVLQRYPQAAQALREANTRMQPPITAAQLAEAEALALAGDPEFAQRGRVLLQQVLNAEPNNVRALWYAGLAAQVAGDDSAAQGAFERLRSQPDLPAEVARALDQLAASKPAQRATPSAASVEEVPEITLRIELGDDLRNQSRPSQTLFVVAKRPNGPPMPLAARKLQTQNFPLQVKLGPEHLLRPDNNWSAQDRLLITARLSTSGQAIAQSGDWQGQEIWAGQADSALTIKLNTVLP